MYVAKFERYWNDYRRKDETKTFSGLAELENWMFGQMQQDYTKDFVMTFPTPAAAVRIKADGPWAIEFRPKWGDENIWIHLIENDAGIIFSDGKFTAGLKHWIREVQEWLTHCEERRKSPKFNFAGVDASPERRWFAQVRWCAEDVIAAAEQNGITLTEAQAEKWLEKNERWFRETLTEYGNEVLASASKESFEEVCKV